MTDEEIQRGIEALKLGQSYMATTFAGALRDPVSVQIPTDPMLLFAFAGYVGSMAKDADYDTLNRIVRVALRMPPDAAIMLMKIAQFCNSKVALTANAREFLHVYKNVLMPKK